MDDKDLEIQRLRRRVEQLERENKKLHERVKSLEEQLDEAQRAKHRQTTRFPRRTHESSPKKPGSPKGHPPRTRTKPDKIDRVVDVPTGSCPECQGDVIETATHEQFQIDLPPIAPVVTQFNIHAGYCSCCGVYVQGRHPEQTSDALGAAGVQFGPTLLTMAAELKHRLGVPYRKICDFYSNYLDIQIAPATLTRAEQRLADKALPTYELLKDALRQCGVVHADETGWRVSRANSWLWVFCSKDVTIYAIRTGEGARGKRVPQEILGDDFDGVLIVDGLASYDALECSKGRCVGHLLRRASDMANAAAPNDARYLAKLTQIFQDAIDLDGRREKLTDDEFTRGVEQIEERLSDWLKFYGHDPSEEMHTLVRHLRRYRDEWLTFLYVPEAEPTNNRAERMLRPSLALRKIGGCNKTLKGALVHEVLASLMVTCRQRSQDFLEMAKILWRSPNPTKAPILG